MRLRTLAALAGVAAIPLVLSIVVEAAGHCFLGGHMYNRNRRVSTGGVIDAECPGSIHSAPFGNWGMISIFGGLENRDQFTGWKGSSPKLQWNSCTQHYKFRAPHPKYYNRPRSGPKVWQESIKGERRADSAWLSRSRNQTCRARWHNKVFTIPNLQTILHELDKPDDSEHVATLGYGRKYIRMSCSSTWICEGRTGWMDPTSVSPSNSRVFGQAYVLLKTAQK